MRPSASQAMADAVGGMQALLEDSMAVFAPNANSYRRFQPGSFAPVDIDWGPGHRGTVDGAEIYAQVCQGCHMPDGRGASGGGTYPSFRDNPNMASAAFVAAVVLHGRRNMPAFAPEHAPAPFFEPVLLTDVQVAAVVNHVRTHFGNDYRDAITAADVAALHPSPPNGD